jgi:predicted ester cyclase
MSTSTQDNKQLVKRFSEQFKNEKQLGIVNEVMTEDFVHHFKDPRIPPGRQGLLALGSMVHEAFPDVRATVEALIAEGDLVVERTTAHGTHRGVFDGVPPSNRQATWSELHVYRIENGRIAELWSEVDFLAIMMQIGALPAPS